MKLEPMQILKYPDHKKKTNNIDFRNRKVIQYNIIGTRYNVIGLRKALKNTKRLVIPIIFRNTNIMQVTGVRYLY